MNSLLQSSGFQQYGNQDEVVLAGRKSARGEDLGMMSQRMLIKAKLTARSSPLTSTTTPLEQLNEKKSLPFESLCVLMGDTSQPCPGKLNNKWNPEDLTTRQKLMDALSEIGYTPLNLTVLSTHTSMLPDLMKLSGSKSMVFNVCDEGFNNNASRELHIPAFMEMIDVRYTGAGPVCLGVCFDKGLTSQTAKSLGIHVPKEVFCSVNDTDQDIEYPVFVKPVKGDNSIGITERSLCRDQNELEKYFIELKAQGMDSLILQEFLSGTEYSVGVLGNKGYYTFLPIVEVDYQKILDQNRVPLLGYESKWDPTSVYWTDIAFKRANLDETKRTYLEEACVKLFERFECRDYARFDFRCDAHGRMKLLEVNPNPGWYEQMHTSYLILLF